MEFLLADSEREDFETLWSIDQQCFAVGIAYTQRELAAYMRQWGSFTLVVRPATAAENDARESRYEAVPGSGIMGFLVAVAGRRGVGHIITIDVLPQARRLGLGSKLLHAAEERLRLANCRSVYLETAVDNHAALAFYKRHQYFLVKTVPRYYANQVDALVLQKDLLSAAQAS